MRKLVPILALVACSTAHRESEVDRAPPTPTPTATITTTRPEATVLRASLDGDGSIAIRHGRISLRLRPRLPLPPPGESSITERVRGEAIELLAQRADGIELSWRFARRPKDAAVRLDLEGATILSSSADGVRVRVGAVIFRIGHGTWVDAAGVRTPVEARVEGDALVYSPMASVVASSRYPATLDPSIGVELELDAPVDDVAAGGASPPLSRFDGTNFAVAWTTVIGLNVVRTRWERLSIAGVPLDAGGLTVRGQLVGLSASATESLVLTNDAGALSATRISKDGKRLDAPPLAIGTPAAGTYASVAFDGTRHVVVWEDGAAVRITHVSSTGTVTQLPATSIVRPLSASAGFACNTTGTCLVLSGPDRPTRDVEATLIGPGDAIGHRFPVTTDPSEYLAGVGSNGADFLVEGIGAASGSGRPSPVFRRVSATGLVGASTIVTPPGAMETTALDGNASGYLLTYGEIDLSGTGARADLGAIRVAASGATTPIWTGSLMRFAGIADQSASVSLAGATGLVAWADGTNSDSDNPKIRGIIFDAGSRPSSSPPSFSIARGAPGQYQSAMASDGTAFLVAWVEERGGKYEIRSRRFDLAGKPLDAAPKILSTLSTLRATPATTDLAVAFDDERYQVTYRDSIAELVAPLMRVRVARDGTPIDSSGVKLQDGGYLSRAPSVAGGGGRSVVAWIDGGTTFFRKYDAAGAPMGALQSLGAATRAAAGDDARVAVSFDGKRFLLSWPVSAGASTDLVGAFIDDTTTAPVSFPIVTTPGAQTNPASASDGKVTLVSWLDVRPEAPPSIRVTRVDDAGKVLDAPGDVLVDVDPAAAPTVAWDGASFVVSSWRKGPSADAHEVVVARVRSDGVVVDEPPWSVTKEAFFPSGSIRVALASDGKGTTFVGASTEVDVAPYLGPRVRLHAFTAKRPAGATCANAADCDDGACVDGVCCKSACTGPCEACDVEGALGTCTPVAGKPHAARRCGATSADVCATGACDGKDTAKCALFAIDVGGACGASSCTGTSFVDTATCSSAHACVPPKSVECSPYRCAPSGCAKTCATDVDCVDRARCVAGSCVASTTGARCTDDGLGSIAADGTVQSCTPLRCDTDGQCAKKCATSADCVIGYGCDLGTTTCTPTAGSDAGSGGCAMSPSESSSKGAVWVLLVGALSLLRRRRAQPRSFLSIVAVVIALVGCRSSVDVVVSPTVRSHAEALKVGAEATTSDATDSVDPHALSAIACHAAGCLVVQKRPPWIVGMRLDSTGKRIDGNGFVIAPDTATSGNPELSVGTNGKDFLVAWPRFFGPSVFVRVSGDGKVVGSVTDVVAASAFAANARIGWDGKTWVVVWREGRGGKPAIVGARFTADGVALDPFGFTVLGTDDSPLDGFNPNMACDDSGCIVGAGLTDASGALVRVVDGKPVGAPLMTNLNMSAVARSGSDLVYAGNGPDGIYVGSFTSSLLPKVSPKRISKGGENDIAIGVLGSDVVVVGSNPSYTSADLARTLATRLGPSLDPVETKSVAWTTRNFYGAATIGSALLVGVDDGVDKITVGPLDLVQEPLAHRAAPHEYPAIAGDGTSRFVAFARRADGHDAILISKLDGTSISPATGTLVANETAPIRDVAIVWDGSQYVVSWVTDARGAFARVDASGSVLDPGGVKLADLTPRGVGWCGLGLGVTTTGAIAVLTGDYATLATVRLTKAGTKLDPTPQQFPLTYAPCDFSIASTGGTSLIGWSAFTINAMRIGSDGKPIDATPKILTPVDTFNRTTPSIATDGTAWYLAFGDARKGSLGYDIRMARHALDLSDAATDAWVVSARDPDQLLPAIALEGGRAMISWVERSETSDELRSSWIDLSTKKVVIDAAKIASFGASELDRVSISSFKGAVAQLVYQRFDDDPTILSPRIKALPITFGALGAAACATNDDCELGPCVDGVCCDRACDGVCEACNEPGAVGKCTTVAGKPRGARSCGAASGCAEATCDGFEKKTCAKFTHAFETKCAEPKCDGALFTSTGYCDGRGACAVPTTASCAPFACDARGCLTSCADDASCAKGFLCQDGKCVAAGSKATCVDDGLSSRSADGSKKDCAPFRCSPAGTCGQSCSTSLECAPGFACDGVSCVAPGGGGGGGGCAVDPPSNGAFVGWLFAAVLGLMSAIARRRRSKKQAWAAQLQGGGCRRVTFFAQPETAPSTERLPRV